MNLAARLRLTLVLSRREAAPATPRELAAAAFAGGATALQLREKNSAPDRELYAQALELRAFCRAQDRLFFVNDRLDLALAVGADGLHLGQDDLPAAVAARLRPPGMLLGVSVGSVAEARGALAAGADYLGLGALFPTGSKDDARLMDHAEARAIVALGAPAVGIGGLTEANAPAAWALGLAGLAVISALTRAPDPRAAAAALLHSRPAAP